MLDAAGQQTPPVSLSITLKSTDDPTRKLSSSAPPLLQTTDQQLVRSRLPHKEVVNVAYCGLRAKICARLNQNWREQPVQRSAARADLVGRVTQGLRGVEAVGLSWPRCRYSVLTLTPYWPARKSPWMKDVRGLHCTARGGRQLGKGAASGDNNQPLKTGFASNDSTDAIS